MSNRNQQEQKKVVGMSRVEKLYKKQQSTFLSFQENARRLVQEEKFILQGSSKNFQLFVKDVLILMDKDIYLSPLAEKEALVSQLPALISEFLKKKPADVRVVSQILVQLSFENIKLKYDRAWLHEARHQLFEKVVRELVDIFCETLQKVGEKDVQKIPVQIIADVIQSISRWEFKFPPEIVEILIHHIETRHISGLKLSPEAAFCFLDGISKIPFKNNQERSMLIAKIAETALPLLLKDDDPLIMFPAKNLTLFRISDLKELLPKPDPRIYGSLVSQFMSEPRNKGKVFKPDMIDAALLDSVIPNKNLNAALNVKEAKLLDDSERRNWHGVSNTAKKGGKFVRTADPYIKYIKYFQEIQNPKGLQWYVLRYSHNIVSDLQKTKGYMTYSLESIKSFLKVLRNHLLNLDFSSVKEVISALCREALSDFHADKLDADMAINLLWINMVLSTVLQDASVAYSQADQAKLFKKILGHTVNESNARALYEIKAMQWHGKIPFSHELNEQMRAHYQKFSMGVNPSPQEHEIYQGLRAALPPHLKTCLRANTICQKTGHEIDIAYTRKSEKQKTAIHVDGPAHFDPVTGLRTLKTQFRDLCLTKAGWHSIVINITEPYDLTTVAAELNQLIKLAAQKPIQDQITPLTQAQVGDASLKGDAKQQTELASSSRFFSLTPSTALPSKGRESDEEDSDEELAFALSLSLQKSPYP